MAQSSNDPHKNVNQFNKFLANNTDFLHERYQQHFKEDSFTFTELQTKSKIQLAIKFIYDVFSFEKYETDQKMNNTLKKSLRENILNFTRKQLISADNNSKEGKRFGVEQAIRLLKYCIQNNEMFAVHYDKKQKKKQQTDEPLQSQDKQKNQTQQLANQQNSEQESSAHENQQQKQSSPQQLNVIKNQSKVSQPKSQKHNIFQQPSHNKMKNQFFTNQETEEFKFNQLLKKQAKIVFQFYCKQQLNAGGPNATFDKISHSANTMTLGKFIALSNTTGFLYTTRVQSLKPKDQKVLDKKTINQIFRKISKFQKQIDFNQFFQLLKALNSIDSKVFEKLNMGKDETSNKILRKLKYFNTPFNMKGSQAKYPEINIDQKQFVPIMTGHSGKFTTSIEEDLIERKQRLKYLPLQPYPNPAKTKTQQTSLLNDMYSSRHVGGNALENKFLQNHFMSQGGSPEKKSKTTLKEQNKIRLQNSRVSIQGANGLFSDHELLKNLITPDDNDDQFLKDYKIPKLNSHVGLKKRSLYNQNSRPEIQQFRLNSVNKGKNVVEELKKRVHQVEKNERKQATSFDKRRESKSVYQ